MELTLVAEFDELQRRQNVLSDGTAEVEFRKCVQMMEESRLQWQATVVEAQRLQRELDRLQRKYEECTRDRLDFETKLFHARRLLEAESKAKRILEDKLSSVCDFLHTDREGSSNVRDTLASLNVSTFRRRSKYGEGNEINSTGSFLDDLSVTQFDEDLLEITRPFKKHRPSTAPSNISYVESNQRRRSIRRSMDLNKNRSFDGDCDEQIIATAKIIIPQDDGPIQAISTIEAVPNSALYDQFRKIESNDLSIESTSSKATVIVPNIAIATPETLSLRSEMAAPMPSAPPLSEMTNNQKLLNLPGRRHEYSTRTIIRTESCVYCLKKLWFGSSVLKCRMCSIFIHHDCKAQYTMSCVPKSHDKSAKLGYITDYVPSSGPMVPPLLIHCISEVEARGLTEKGIYRVSGSDKEIKALKERILRGKSVFNLSTVDIHVICGCLKDFLRHLREPLIPTNLWKNFTNAVQMINVNDVKRELRSAIDQLPQANRDTLAYLILHLQRVADRKAVQMPIENLAVIFGPTVLGYSCSDPEHHVILSETMVQKDVVENLLKISAHFWTRFINPDSVNENDDNMSNFSFFGTPNGKLTNRTLRKERKFFHTPPYSTRR